MADCGFHSPQFSEELAYLPPWLQPQLPRIPIDVKDKSSISMQPFQDILYSQENACLQQNDQQQSLITGKAGFNSCHLYLSEDTDTLQGSIPSTDNVNLTVDEFTKKFEHHLLEQSTEQAFHLSLHLSCTLSQDKDTPLTSNYEISKCAGTEPTFEAQETPTDNVKGHIKTTKKDTLTLSQADIEEAIELSIAASEAMVITEVVSLDLDAFQFPVSNTLEAALRVKEARRQTSEIASGAFLEHDEESDSLSDLDECAMAAAYADAGVSDKSAPDSNFNIHSLDNYHGSTLVPCSIKESTCSLQILNLKNPTQNEENSTAVESEKGPDKSGGTQKNLKELEGSPENDKKVAIQGKTCTGIIKKPFIRESSFLSESMDTLGFPFAPVEEHGIEIVASSTPTNARNKCLNQGFFSSIDSLCSAVPCSLSNPCMDQISNKEKITVDLQETFSRLQNVQDGADLVKRTMSTLPEYSVGIRDVQFNKAPQTFDKKHSDDSDVMLDEVCGDMNLSHKDLKTRVVVETVGSKNKRVRFLDVECVDKEVKRSERMKYKEGHSSISRTKGVKNGLDCASRTRKRKCSSFAGDTTERQKMIFQGLDFLLTGLSNLKLRELQCLIRRYGGRVLTKLPDCPSNLRPKLVESTHWRPPVVICPKMVATTKFLYGCAIDSWVLHPQWIVDSVQSGHLLPPSKYLVRQLRESTSSYLDEDIFCFRRHTHIFHGMGFLLYGKVGFSSKHSNIIKHGGGEVFQSLQSLVRSLTAQKIKTGIILLVENEARSSRHLKLCALEHRIQTVPVDWITKTLYAGKFAPFKREKDHLLFGRIKVPKKKTVRDEAFDMSQEI